MAIFRLNDSGSWSDEGWWERYQDNGGPPEIAGSSGELVVSQRLSEQGRWVQEGKLTCMLLDLQV